MMAEFKSPKIIFLVLTLLIFSGANFLSLKVVEVGKEVPDFSLEDPSGNVHTLSELRGQSVMIHFWSSTCPYVIRYEERLQAITRDYADKNVRVLAINSNDNETREQIQKVAEKRELNYPVLIDPENRIADQYGAITTPHVYIVDPEGKLAFEGAVDDQGWSEENTPSTHYARDALDAVLQGNTPATPLTKTIGCTVKRKF